MTDIDDTRTITTTAVSVTGVRKNYGELAAVAGIDLAVRTGEFFGILGPNGAGKTTLVEMMEGLRSPDAGEIRVLGEPVWPRNVKLLPRIGVQTQSSAFFVRLTAREHLATVAALYRVDSSAAARALTLVGLDAKADTRVDDLSGGQRQRLAIAAALVHDPELIFLDEPTAALDPQARRELWGVLRSLKKQGRTIVYTTHHLDEAQALCDRVAIVVGGRIAALDTPQQLMSRSSGPSRILVPFELLAPNDAAAIPGVIGVDLEGGSVVLQTRTLAATLTEVAHLVDLERVTTRTASLEDVYLELTETETVS